MKLLVSTGKSVKSNSFNIHSKPVLWEPRIRETRNYGINLIGPNFFPFVSLLFFPAFKGSAYKGIPPIWDEIFGPLNNILSPIWDFSYSIKFFVRKLLQMHKKEIKKKNLNACLKVNDLKAVINRRI